jgi:hypothetical protein
MTAPDFTIADVLAWARTKPADERYDFTNSLACALAQFGKATGRLHLVGSSGSATLFELGPDVEDAFACGSDDHETFGQLVRNLEKLCPEQPRSDWSRLSSYMVDIDGEMA